VLLDQWTARQRGAHIVRVTIRPTDDLRRIPARIISGLDLRDATVARQLRGEIGARRGVDPSLAILAALSRTSDTVLVLEAVDAPGDLGVIDELTTIFDQAPPTVRGIVATRSWWPPAIEQSSRRRDISRIDSRDLDFTVEEARQVVTAVAGVDLAAAQLHRLMQLSQGWAAAIAMVALELRHAPPDQTLDGLAGGNRHVRAFLKDGVLASQPAEVRRFLIETSVLNHLDARLCDTVTGRRESGAMLHLLRRNGLFIRQARGERESFTYHPLFRSCSATSSA
jgi:LuxR family maltose regulon positive regulatory protein